MKLESYDVLVILLVGAVVVFRHTLAFVDISSCVHFMLTSSSVCFLAANTPSVGLSGRAISIFEGCIENGGFYSETVPYVYTSTVKGSFNYIYRSFGHLLFFCWHFCAIWNLQAMATI